MANIILLWSGALWLAPTPTLSHVVSLLLRFHNISARQQQVKESSGRLLYISLLLTRVGPVEFNHEMKFKK